MQEEIMKRLSAISLRHQVRIVMAIESGSRAWGFASPNSDYDVRFVYVHPTKWYLGVSDSKRDVIEEPISDDLDINGWDMRKMLQLLRKSNPTAVEWLRSPISYIDDGFFKLSANALLTKSYTPVAGFHHYFNMAKGNYNEHLLGETVNVKKYLYVLRALLSALWITLHKSPPPIQFDVLLKELLHLPIVSPMYDDVMMLMHKKRNASESWFTPRLLNIDQFITDTFKLLPKANTLKPQQAADITGFDSIFQHYHKV